MEHDRIAMITPRTLHRDIGVRIYKRGGKHFPIKTEEIRTIENSCTEWRDVVVQSLKSHERIHEETKISFSEMLKVFNQCLRD